MRVAVAFSGGKDSTYTVWLLLSQGFEPVLLSVKPGGEGSWVFHYPNVEFTWLQAEAMGLPWIGGSSTVGEEEEVEAFKELLSEAIRCWGVEGLASGVVYSWYQKSLFEKVSESLGLKLYTPLWGKNCSKLIEEEISSGMRILVTAVAAEGFDESWLGCTLDEKALAKLRDLERRYGVSLLGEGGEMETMVVDAPFFRYTVSFSSARRVWQGSSGYLRVEHAELKPKLL